jgi:AP2-associated kinase
VRLCDFGSCLESPIYCRNISEKEAAEAAIQKETTQMYRAPEMADIYMREVLTEKTDIWALGCIFFALCFLKHPFQDKGNLGILSGSYTIPAQSPVPPDAHVFLQRMLDVSLRLKHCRLQLSSFAYDVRLTLNPDPQQASCLCN